MNSFVMKAIGMSSAECEILAPALRFTLQTVSVDTVSTEIPKEVPKEVKNFINQN